LLYIVSHNSILQQKMRVGSRLLSFFCAVLETAPLSTQLKNYTKLETIHYIPNINKANSEFLLSKVKYKAITG